MTNGPGQAPRVVLQRRGQVHNMKARSSTVRNPTPMACWHDQAQLVQRPKGR